jgi:hypothetical protein
LKALSKKMASSVSAGVTLWMCDSFAAIEIKKAQICRLSLLNIVRCHMGFGISIVASCVLIRNISVRCYVR